MTFEVKQRRRLVFPVTYEVTGLSLFRGLAGRQRRGVVFSSSVVTFEVSRAGWGLVFVVLVFLEMRRGLVFSAVSFDPVVGLKMSHTR